jgi:hypothetical protein
MRISTAALVTTLAITAALPRLHAQRGDQTIVLETASGRVSGSITMPASALRPPVVLLTGAAESAEIATALGTAGIASLRVDAADAPTLAQWIARLRNDERFPTVTVVADGPALGAAVIAARAARADGVFVRGDAAAAADELSRLVAAKSIAAGGPATADAAKIAEFVRTVPVLGRRGTSADRPATTRRSPRQVLLTSVGSVRVGVEWGAPQKRGREIWGSLVRWDQTWMPGADEASTITTSGALVIGTLEVPAGDHTIYVHPGRERFQLIISNDVGQFHTVRDATRELGRTDMTAGTRPDAVEDLTFAVEPHGSTAVFKLIWDVREYTVPVSAR